MSIETSMRPLDALDVRIARRVEVLLTDIDDTVSTDGRIEADAYAAIERLTRAGIRVVPVTGRPAGWCDMIARFWPVEAVVGENGAFYFRYLRRDRRMLRAYAQTEAERAHNRARLDRIAAEVLASVPGSRIAADQPYRIADLAVDFAEDVPPLSREDIDRIKSVFDGVLHGDRSIETPEEIRARETRAAAVHSRARRDRRNRTRPSPAPAAARGGWGGYFFSAQRLTMSS